MAVIDLDDYRKGNKEEIIFEDDDALIDFIYTWMESILTKKEINLIAKRLEQMEINNEL